MLRNETLPIYEIRDTLAKAMEPCASGIRLIIEAPTGSGKSTQIPRMLINDGLIKPGEVVVLQPRRLAARMLARRVAQEQGTRLGQEVGYQVRFDKVTSAQTRIRYVTEGILLREMLANPRLPGIGAILFDEFHERHLYGDITLARAMDLQATRPDLVLLVMSATLEAGRLRDYLAPCQCLRSEGRAFPVEIRYSAPKGLNEEAWNHAARVCAQASHANAGDLLIFMPGAYEIRKTIETIRREKWAHQFDVLPLHGELPAAQQDRAVDPSARRKVIVSTNVAETSITVDGVTTVIDSGLVRRAQFDSQRSINTLTIQRISQASAHQRAGRAGRTQPGICWRLWSESDHARRPVHEVPEILRMDLAEVVLTLLASGDLENFRWFERPVEQSLAQAIELLRELGAVSLSGGHATITALGRELVKYPVHPRHARILEAARAENSIPLFALILALLQGRPIFGKAGAAPPERFVVGGEFSDLQPMLRAWAAARECRFDFDECARLGVNSPAAREAAQLAAQLSGLVGQSKAADDTLTEISAETFGKILLSGFPDQVARRLNEGSLVCNLPGGRRGQLARESLLRRCPLVVAAEVHEIEGREVQVLLGGATAIDEKWLEELFPDDYQRSMEVAWDETQRRVMQKERTVFRDLILSERQSGEPDTGKAASILTEKVSSGELRLTGWDDSVEQWIARVNCLARWMPELELPPLDTSARAFVIEQMCQGALSYKDIKERSPWPTLRAWLSPSQAVLLDKFAPERLTLPDGRSARIVYSENADPMVSARIQQLFGLNATPELAAGRVTVVLSILGPNMRPLQVTKDLAGFWKNHYPRLKQELQRKYPKHQWR
ncbi:MAG: ATP-dependent helicase HrpB [Verrucomicrobiales bacterium]